MTEKSNPRQAIMDMIGALKGVFKDYSRTARKRAWKSLISAKGKREIDKILVTTSRPLAPFRTLQFSEWMLVEEVQEEFAEKLTELQQEPGVQLAHGAAAEPHIKEMNLGIGIIVSTSHPAEHFIGLDYVGPDTLLNWPHHQATNIYVVTVPDDTRYEDILKFHPENQRKYIVPNLYVKGFFDVDNAQWVDNPKYHPASVPDGYGEVSQERKSQPSVKQRRQQMHPTKLPAQGDEVPVANPGEMEPDDIW